MKKFTSRTPILALAVLLGGHIASAQTTITYTDGQNDATAYSTSAPHDPLTLTIATGVATQSGEITGTGGVIKTGAGTLILEGFTPNWLGETRVSAGTLVWNMIGSSSEPFLVASGAKLGGLGVFQGRIDVHGTLSPGQPLAVGFDEIWVLVSEQLALHSGSTFEYQLDSSKAHSVGADLQEVGSSLELNGTVALTIDDLADVDAAYALGTTFSLLNYFDGAWNGGRFSYEGNELSDGELFTAGLNTWAIFYEAEDGGENFAARNPNNNGRFVTITAAPEPTSALLLLGSGAMLLLRRRRASV